MKGLYISVASAAEVKHYERAANTLGGNAFRRVPARFFYGTWAKRRRRRTLLLVLALTAIVLTISSIEYGDYSRITTPAGFVEIRP